MTAIARQRLRERGQRGLTIVELMMSLVVSSVLILAALTVGSQLLAAYGEHRHSVEMLRSARGSLDILADAVRNASPGVPSGNIVDLVGCTNTGALRLVNSSSGPDELEVISASGGVITALRAPFTATSNQLVVGNATGIAPGDLVVVTDFTTGHIARVDTIALSGSNTLLGTSAPSTCAVHNMPVSGYPVGALVLRAQLMHFRVALLGSVPALMLDPDAGGPRPEEPLAIGIEDFQVAVGVDLDGNGDILDANSTTDEWFYNVPGDGVAPNLLTNPWRTLRLSIVARTETEETGIDQYTRPALEDHGTQAADAFRRRSLSTTIDIRNLRGSP